MKNHVATSAGLTLRVPTKTTQPRKSTSHIPAREKKIRPTPLVDRSMQEESVAQTLVFDSQDYAEMKQARSDGREPVYRGR